MVYNDVYCADCVSFMRLHQFEANTIIADFPYKDVVETEWDTQWKTDKEYLEWVEEVIKQLYLHLKENGNLLIYCSRQLEHRFKVILENIGFIEQRTIIWARKRDRNNTRGKTLGSGYEPILWYSKGNNFTFNNIKVPPEPRLLKRKEYQPGGILADGVGLTDVWSDIPALPHNSKEKTEHKTQKPLLLCDRLIKLFSNENDLIYIPFAGSGSEIVSCIQNNRLWVATEINNGFINEIINPRIKGVLG